MTSYLTHAHTHTLMGHPHYAKTESYGDTSTSGGPKIQ